MSSMGGLDAFWGVDSPTVEDRLGFVTNNLQYDQTIGGQPLNDIDAPIIGEQGIYPWPFQTLDQQPCAEDAVDLIHPSASVFSNIPPSRLSQNSSYFWDGESSFEHGSIERMSSVFPEDDMFSSGPSTTRQASEEVQIQNPREPNNESLRIHSPTQVHENIPRDDFMMRRYIFGIGFIDPPNIAIANYHPQAPVRLIATTSSGSHAGLQHVDSSTPAGSERTFNSPHHDAQLDGVESANSGDTQSNKKARRARIRSTTRAGVPRWTANDLGRAQEMRSQGKTIAEIALALNRSENSVTGKLWRVRGNDAHRSDKRYQDRATS